MKGAKLQKLRLPAFLAEAGIDQVLVYEINLTHRFRRIDVRDGLLLHGPQGWGECSPFWDYDTVESSAWLRAGVEAACEIFPEPRRQFVPVNVTIPVVSPGIARQLVLDSGGCATAKVKVADPRSTIDDDCARVAAVREALGPSGKIRIDANAAWSVEQACEAIKRLDKAAASSKNETGLEYVEQPCASIVELAEVRRNVDVPIAADESVRRASDPLAVAKAGAADLIIVKVQPLGGVRRALDIVAESGLDAVVSSALDTSVGVHMGAQLAAALPDLNHACGLATVELFTADVTTRPLLPRGGAIDVRTIEVDQPIGSDISDELMGCWAQRLNDMCAVLSDDRGNSSW